MSDTKTVLVDGLSVVTTDAGAQAIHKLQQQIKDGQAVADQAEIKHREENKALHDSIAKLQAERDDLKGKVLTDAALDARVNERADLVTTAKAIHDGDYTGKSDADIRKAAVVGKLGAAVVDGKPDAYVQARFDIEAEKVKQDPVRGVLRDGATTRQAVNDNGYAESVAAFDRNKKEA